MNCHQCDRCIQISADGYEVKCKCVELGCNGETWEKQPSYCKYFLHKLYKFIKKEENK